jgi:hypothetical protein
VFRSRLGLEEEFHAWHAKISTELLFASYLEFANGRGERRLLSRESLGRFFAELKAEPTRWRNGVVGEHIIDVDNIHRGTSRKAALVRKERTTGYAVGPLERSRQDFTTATGLAVTWDGGVAADDAD